MSTQSILMLLTIVFLPAYSSHLWFFLVDLARSTKWWFRRYFQEPFVVTRVCDRLSTRTNVWLIVQLTWRQFLMDRFATCRCSSLSCLCRLKYWQWHGGMCRLGHQRRQSGVIFSSNSRWVDFSGWRGTLFSTISPCCFVAHSFVRRNQQQSPNSSFRRRSLGSFDWKLTNCGTFLCVQYSRSVWIQDT